MNLDDYATTHEAADRLNIHHESVRRLIRLGELPAIKVFNRRWLIDKNVLEQFANSYSPLPYHHKRRLL